jgi:hypothetical protein
MNRPIQYHDVEDKQLLFAYLNEKETEIAALKKDLDSLRSRLASQSSQKDAGPVANIKLDKATMTAIRDALSVKGNFELRVDGLPGVLAQPQYPLIPRLTALPNPQSTLYSAVAVIGATSDTIYILDRNAVPHKWYPFLSVPANMVTTDTAQNILAQKTFTVTQLMAAALAGFLEWKITNASNNAAAIAGYEAINDGGASVKMLMHSTTRVATRYGTAVANFAELLANLGSAGLLIGTTDNAPTIFGTNSIERMRLYANGDFRISGPSGSYTQWTYQQETITLAAAASTDSSADLLTGLGLVKQVVARVQTTVTGPTTSIDVGDSTTAARFGNIGTLTAGAQNILLNHWKGGVATDATGPVEFTARKVRLTANGGNPTGGTIKIITLCEDSGVPTS